MEHFVVGIIRGTHGLAGNCKVESTSGEFQHFSGMKDVVLRKNGVETKRTIEKVSFGGGILYIKFSGINSPEEAKKLSGSEIVVSREFACPCGKNRAKTEKIDASHSFIRFISDGKVDCEICGQEFDESVLYPDRNCTCICNSYYENAFKTFVYKFKLFFWKLFRVNQVCECGRHLHYYITN